jgi:hypothetical protein
MPSNLAGSISRFQGGSIRLTGNSLDFLFGHEPSIADGDGAFADQRDQTKAAETLKRPHRQFRQASGSA